LLKKLLSLLQTTQNPKTIASRQDGTAKRLCSSWNSSGKETHGQVLTGKQEHCRSFPDLQTSLESGITDETTDLKRELIAQQVKFEITELNSPTALQRFGAPSNPTSVKSAPGLRPADPTVHLRASCQGIPVSRQGEGGGVLAR